MAVRKRPYLPQLTDPATHGAVTAAFDQIDRIWGTLDTRLGDLSRDDVTDLGRRLVSAELELQELRAVVMDLQASVAESPTDPTSIPSGTAQPRAPTPGGTTPGTHPDYSAAVATAKADLVTAGVDLSGPCGAFEIIKLATYRLSQTDPEVGILSKPAGNNCDGFAVDIIVFVDGYAVDALIGSGVDNTPTWGVIPPVDPARWRSPIPGAIP